MVSPPDTHLTSRVVKRLGWVLSKHRGLALALLGEAGVGKTWTARQVLQQIPCRSLSLSAVTPLQTLAQLLPRPTRSPLWIEQGLERLLRGGAETRQSTNLLAAWLAELAPFVLHLEDLHEASPEGLEGVYGLARAVTRSRGVALLVTSRTLPQEPFEGYWVEALSPQAITALLEAEAHASLPPEASTWIFSHARGNPLFALKYFRHLSRQGYLWSDGTAWRWRQPPEELMPDTVEALIAHSLLAADTAPHERTLLAARALLPAGAEPALWARVAGVNPQTLTETQAHLEQAAILRDGDFVHPLFRDVVRREIGPAERQTLARRAIEALADEPEQAADFLPEAGLEAGQALELLERAIRARRARGDSRGVAELLARKAQYASGGEQARLALEAAQVMRDHDLSEALSLARFAVSVSKDHPEPHLEAVYLYADLLAEFARGKEAEGLLAGLPHRQRQTTRWLEALLRVKQQSHDYAGVLALWQEHAASGQKIPYAIIARAHVQLRLLEEAEAVLEAALARPDLEPYELAELLYIRAFIPHFAGDYATAETGFTRFLAALDDLDDGSLRFRELRGGALQLRAYDRNALERPREALTDIQEAMRLPAETGNGSTYAFRQAEYGLYRMECGDYPQAEDAILEAQTMLERVGNLIYLSWVERITARLYLEWAPPHGAALALRHARAALRYARQAQSPTFVTGALFVSAWAEARHGRPEEALGLLPELEQLAQETRQPAFLGAASWVGGLALERLGRGAEAREALEEAGKRAQPIPIGPSPERMALELDRLKGDLAAARRRVERWRRQGVGNAIQIAERYFPALTAPAEPSLPELAPAAHLRVLGSVQVLVNGETISDRNRKGKELLALLLEARLGGRPEVAQLELYDTLYPQLEEERAVAALKQLVYRLRSNLGAEAILRTPTGYALGAVSSDAEAFLNTGDTHLWRGPYMQGLGETWHSLSADSLYASLREKTQQMISTQPREASRLGRILVEADPYDTQALALLLRALDAEKNPKALQTVYEQARKQWLEVGETLPQDWAEFLARYS